MWLLSDSYRSVSQLHRSGSQIGAVLRRDAFHSLRSSKCHTCQFGETSFSNWVFKQKK